jgi:uncharacterized membrane protein
MNWRFTFDTSPLLLLPLGVLAAVVVLLLYRGTTRPVGPLQRTLLGLLRWGALAAVVFCLFNPLWVRSEPLAQKGLFAVILDTSSSMSLTDGDEGVSRLDQARKIIEQSQPALDTLAESLSVRYYALDTRPHRITGPGDCAPTGIRSALLDSTAELVGRRHGVPLYGAFLISDGADNASDDHVAALEQIRAAGVPVYTAGVGGPQGVKDFEVTQFQMPWRVQSGASAPARITVSAQAAEPGEVVTVELLDGDSVAATAQFPWPANTAARTVELKAVPVGSGYRRFTARAAGTTPETITDNNRRSRFVKIETTELPRILYVEGHPRMEFKFLRRSLESDSAIRFAALLYVGANRAIRSGLAPREVYAGIPDRLEEYADFRAVILGDFSPQSLSADQMKALEQFVYRQGGGLLLLGGPLTYSAALEGTPLQALSPFRLRDDGAKVSYRIGGPFSFNIEPGGRAHAALSAFQASTATRKEGAKLPPLSGVNMLPRVKPAAELLATWQSDGAGGPLLAAHRYGVGWVAGFASDEMWYLRMRLPAADDRYERLVRGLVHWLASAGRPEVLISVDRDQAAPLEPVEVTVQAFDARQDPISSAEVVLEIISPDGDTESLRMQPDLAVPGAYRAQWTGDKAGEHVLRAGVPSGEMKFDYAQCIVAVTPDAVELKSAARNDAVLRYVSEYSGGQFIPSGRSPDFSGVASAIPEPEKVLIRKSAWDRPWLLAAILALFCLELILRRRLGLS